VPGLRVFRRPRFGPLPLFRPAPSAWPPWAPRTFPGARPAPSGSPAVRVFSARPSPAGLSAGAGGGDAARGGCVRRGVPMALPRGGRRFPPPGQASDGGRPTRCTVRTLPGRSLPGFINVSALLFSCPHCPPARPPGGRPGRSCSPPGFGRGIGPKRPRGVDDCSAGVSHVFSGCCFHLDDIGRLAPSRGGHRKKSCPQGRPERGSSRGFQCRHAVHGLVDNRAFVHTARERVEIAVDFLAGGFSGPPLPAQAFRLYYLEIV
jgi:hypothetical protein